MAFSIRKWIKKKTVNVSKKIVQAWSEYPESTLYNVCEDIKEIINVPERRKIDASEFVLSDMMQFSSLYKANIEEYELRWKEIISKYKKIKVYLFRVETLGESIIRAVYFSKKQENNNDEYELYLPYVTLYYRLCNSCLIDLVSRKVNIISPEDINFWVYCIKKYRHMFDFSEYKKYRIGKTDYPVVKMNKNEVIVEFTESEKKEGESFLKNIGLVKDYVCFNVRNDMYNIKTRGFDEKFDYRNFEFSVYENAIDYLREKDLMVVKIGRMEDPVDTYGKYIDYAGLYADDFFDFYLISKCKFMLVGTSGIYSIGDLFGVPRLIVNAAPIASGYGGESYSEYDLYMPQKCYDKTKKRYLSLEEQFEKENVTYMYQDKMEAEGIVYIKNTEDEICEAVIEMNSKLDGTWENTQEDKALLKRYNSIMKRLAVQYTDKKNNGGAYVPYNISVTYLRNNRYLLD